MQWCLSELFGDTNARKSYPVPSRHHQTILSKTVYEFSFSFADVAAVLSTSKSFFKIFATTKLSSFLHFVVHMLPISLPQLGVERRNRRNVDFVISSLFVARRRIKIVVNQHSSILSFLHFLWWQLFENKRNRFSSTFSNVQNVFFVACFTTIFQQIRPGVAFSQLQRKCRLSRIVFAAKTCTKLHRVESSQFPHVERQRTFRDFTANPRFGRLFVLRYSIVERQMRCKFKT